MNGSGSVVDGSPVRTEYEELNCVEEDFEVCGHAFEASQRIGDNNGDASGTSDSAGPGQTGGRPAAVSGRIGLAFSRLVSQRALVDFAAEWFTLHRSGGTRP